MLLGAVTLAAPAPMLAATKETTTGKAAASKAGTLQLPKKYAPAKNSLKKPVAVSSSGQGPAAKPLPSKALESAGMKAGSRTVNAAADTGQAISILGIRSGISSGKTRVVIETDTPAVFRSFTLSKPARLVVDLPPARWKTAQNKGLTGKVLSGYRSGLLDNGLLRVVFDLRDTAIIDTAFNLPPQGTNKHRVVIDMAAASANMFAARERQVYGAADILEQLQNKPSARSVPELDRRMMDMKTASASNITTEEPEPAAAPAETATVTDKAATELPAATDAPPVPARKPAQVSSGFTADRPAMKGEGSQNAKPARSKKDKYVVVIDAGHGGGDPGALAVNGVKEKNITLAVARALKEQLEETGRYKVVMTRNSDVYIPLRERVNISREKGGDVFVSIHADKVGRSQIRGASIYTLSANASDAETERLAEQENNAGVVAGVDLSEESQDVAGILLDLSMREKMNESNLLAGYMRSALKRESVKLLPNSHRSAGFAVLKAPDIPAVLIETGFLSNPEEAKLLNSGAFQEKIAAAMALGIDAFFTKLEALQGTP